MAQTQQSLEPCAAVKSIHFLAIKTKVCISFYYLQALAAYKVHKLPYLTYLLPLDPLGVQDISLTYCCFQYHVTGLLDNLYRKTTAEHPNYVVDNIHVFILPDIRHGCVLKTSISSEAIS